MILMVFTNFLIILTSNIFDITNPTIDFTFLALLLFLGFLTFLTFSNMMNGGSIFGYVQFFHFDVFFRVFDHFLMFLALFDVGTPQIEFGGSIIQRPWTGTWGSGDRQNPLGVRSKSAKNHVFDDF